MHREKAAVYKKACWENLAVWFVLTLIAVWLPGPWGAICWAVAVGFGCLSCAQCQVSIWHEPPEPEEREEV